MVDIYTRFNDAELKASGKDIVVSGDGQIDSPGFSAKYCTYTLMDIDLYYILDVKVVDVRHAQLKSSVMEKVGCKQALEACNEEIKHLQVGN